MGICVYKDDNSLSLVSFIWEITVFESFRIHQLVSWMIGKSDIHFKSEEMISIENVGKKMKCIINSFTLLLRQFRMMIRVEYMVNHCSLRKWLIFSQEKVEFSSINLHEEVCSYEMCWYSAGSEACLNLHLIDSHLAISSSKEHLASFQAIKKCEH